MAQNYHGRNLGDNLHLWYGIIPLNLTSSCDGCKKTFTVEHALSCPNGGLFLICHNDAEREWGELGTRGLTTSAISYKPHINSRMVQGGRPVSGVRMGQGDDWRGDTGDRGYYGGGR